LFSRGERINWDGIALKIGTPGRAIAISREVTKFCGGCSPANTEVKEKRKNKKKNFWSTYK